MKIVALFAVLACASARPDAPFGGYNRYTPPAPPPPVIRGYDYPVPTTTQAPIIRGYDYPVPVKIPETPVVPLSPLYEGPSQRYAPKVVPLGLEIVRYNVRGQPLPLRTDIRSIYDAPSSGGELVLNPPPHIVDHNVVIKDDGSYNFDYLTSHGISHIESGVKGVSKTGTVSYTSPEGINIGLGYIADQYGYRPVGAHLPVHVQLTPEVRAATLAAAQAHAKATAELPPLVEQPFVAQQQFLGQQPLVGQQQFGGQQQFTGFRPVITPQQPFHHRSF